MTLGAFVPRAAPLLMARGVGKRRGSHWALRGINLSLSAGEIAGFIGPNGAGKTTLMKLLAGLSSPTEGELEVLGQRLHEGALHTPAGVGLVLEEMGFVPYLSGRKNLELLARLREGASPGFISTVLERVGLDPRDTRPVRTYSLGMRQRLSLAQALMERPQLLLLDEPTNGLDPLGIVELRSLLKQLSQEGTAILLASHLLTEVEHLCHRVLLVQRGMVLRELENFSGAVSLRLVVTGEADAAGALAWAQGAGLRAVRLPDELQRPVFRLEGPLPPTPEVLQELVSRKIGIEGIGVVRQSLEELFLLLTAGGPAGGVP